eukprot:TRINITY_DN21528_c0_g1_i1.p1 TRINITY_DN21528_c0_g1~~TRINITY_DN21528_c0_g1_i1.p1  ORF type:complete len:265 (+),score=24.56 TRINITY_DN21528_c0_g1_i1:82-876(+)
MSRPDLLLAECHGAALRILSEYKNIHFQGLQVASRRCQELPRPLRKRLMQMEIAHNIVRHVTLPSCNALLNDLVLALNVKESTSSENFQVERVCCNPSSAERVQADAHLPDEASPTGIVSPDVNSPLRSPPRSRISSRRIRKRSRSRSRSRSCPRPSVVKAPAVEHEVAVPTHDAMPTLEKHAGFVEHAAMVKAQMEDISETLKLIPAIMEKVATSRDETNAAASCSEASVARGEEEDYGDVRTGLSLRSSVAGRPSGRPQIRK